MPRSRSTFIQSLRARRLSPRALTAPASWIAPPNKSSFSVSVVLPASGCAMIAKVRRFAICAGSSSVDMTAQSTVCAPFAQPAQPLVRRAGETVREAQRRSRCRGGGGSLLARPHDRRTKLRRRGDPAGQLPPLRWRTYPAWQESLHTWKRHGVRFLRVGGHAVDAHGRPRYTQDRDVLVEPTPANARRVSAAI